MHLNAIKGSAIRPGRQAVAQPQRPPRCKASVSRKLLRGSSHAAARSSGTVAALPQAVDPEQQQQQQQRREPSCREPCSFAGKCTACQPAVPIIPSSKCLPHQNCDAPATQVSVAGLLNSIVPFPGTLPLVPCTLDTEIQCLSMEGRIRSMLSAHMGSAMPTRLQVPDDAPMLGVGGYSYVVLGSLREESVAVKLQPLQQLTAVEKGEADAWLQQAPIRELALMYDIGQHPYIAGALSHKVLTRSHSPEGEELACPYFLAIAMHKMPSDLWTHITTKQAAFDEKTAIQIVIKVAQALEFMHSRGQVHADVKPSNVLFDPDTLDIQLADFGSSFPMPHGKHEVKFTTEISTKAYRSPEALFDGIYTYGQDIWCLGLLLCELLMGKVCYLEDDDAKLQRLQLLQEDYGYICSLDREAAAEPEHLRNLQSMALGFHKTSLRRGLLPRRNSPKLRSLVLRMLSEDPHDRPGAEEVIDDLEHIMRKM